MKTRSIGLVAVFAALAVLMSAQPSSAAPKVPKGDTAPPFTSGAVCDFPVEFTVTSAALQRVVLPNGSQVVSGPAVVTVTNTDSSESVTYNISGPVKQNPETGQVTLYGLNLILGLEGESGPPDERKFLWLTAGTLTINGTQPIFEEDLQGHIRFDICAELAA